MTTLLEGVLKGISTQSRALYNPDDALLWDVSTIRKDTVDTTVRPHPTPVSILRHLMGKHDQKSHGRSGNALTSVQEEKILAVEQAIKAAPVERGAIVDSEGSLLLYKSGTKTSVPRNSQEAAMVKDNVFTHNHPNDSPLSAADMLFAVEQDALQVRAVGVLDTYIIDRPSGGWPKGVLSRDAMYEEVDITFKRKRLEVINRVGAASYLKSHSTNQEQVYKDALHETWGNITARHSIKYTKVSTPNIPKNKRKPFRSLISRDNTPITKKELDDLEKKLDVLIAPFKKEIQKEGPVITDDKSINRVDVQFPENTEYADELRKELAVAFDAARGRITKKGIAGIVAELQRRRKQKEDDAPERAVLRSIAGKTAAVVEQSIIDEALEVLISAKLLGLGWLKTVFNVERVTYTFQQAFSAGLKESAEDVQKALYTAGKVDSPNVLTAFNLSNPEALAAMNSRALALSAIMDEGTSYHMVNTFKSSFSALGPGSEQELVAAIYDNLTSEEQGAFSKKRLESIVRTEMNYVHSEGRLAQMDALGLKKKQWIAVPVVACPICMRNQGKGVVPIDYNQYESVFGSVSHPPGHPTICHCRIDIVMEELEGIESGDISYWDGGDRPESTDRSVWPLTARTTPSVFYRSLTERNAQGHHNQKSHAPGVNASGATSSTIEAGIGVSDIDNASPLLESVEAALLEEYVSSLTDDEFAAIKAYKGADYSRINDPLRGTNVSEAWGFRPMDTETRIKRTAELDSALQKGELPTNTMLYRGMITENLLLNDTGTPLKVGSVFTDKGFTSTSHKLSAASRFGDADYQAVGTKGTKTVMHIKAAAGTKGGFIGLGNKSLIKVDAEREFLLPRGSKFMVTKIEVSGGVSNVRVTLLPSAGVGKSLLQGRNVVSESAKFILDYESASGEPAERSLLHHLAGKEKIG